MILSFFSFFTKTALKFDENAKVKILEFARIGKFQIDNVLIFQPF
jgi:hypothetical protein